MKYVLKDGEWIPKRPKSMELEIKPMLLAPQDPIQTLYATLLEEWFGTPK